MIIRADRSVQRRKTPARRWLTAALLAALSTAALADESNQWPDPADPAANVPAAAYVSVFAEYQPLADPEQSPDKTWRAANAEVAALGGHAGHLNAEAPDGKPAANEQQRKGKSRRTASAHMHVSHQGQ